MIVMVYSRVISDGEKKSSNRRIVTQKKAYDFISRNQETRNQEAHHEPRGRDAESIF